jgi:hypothetical protein
MKKDFKVIMLKILVGLLIADIIFIPLCIYAEIKPMVGLSIFVLFPLVLAIIVVLLSRSCVKSYNGKKKAIEEKLKSR